jgi:rhodanese-related sulfurtransferase
MFNLFTSKAKKYEDIPAGPFHDLMTQPNAVVIDVRTAGEFAGGKLRGARNIDIMSSNFVTQIKNLPLDLLGLELWGRAWQDICLPLVILSMYTTALKRKPRL